MKHEDFEKWLRKAIQQATPERAMTFARDTVLISLRQASFDSIDPKDELDEVAWQAFVTVRGKILAGQTNTKELRSYIKTIDAGVLSDGDMDSALLFMLIAIDRWVEYLENNSLDRLYYLESNLIDEIDFNINGIDLADVLASPEMQVERDRIVTLLNAKF